MTDPVKSVVVEEAGRGVMKSWVLGPYRVGHTINVTCVAGPGTLSLTYTVIRFSCVCIIAHLFIRIACLV